MDASDATPLIWGQERHPEQTALKKQNAPWENYAFSQKFSRRWNKMRFFCRGIYEGPPSEKIFGREN